MSARDPRAFARFQERAFRGASRAFVLFLLGVAVGGAGIVLSQSVPSAWVVALVLLAVGLGLLVAGLFLLVQRFIRRVKETVVVSRELRQPESPAPLPTSPSIGVIPGNIALSPLFRKGGDNPSWVLLGFSILIVIGVAAGSLDLVVQPANRSEQSFLFLALFSLLVPALLLLADSLRPIPGLLTETPSPVVYFTEGGAEGPFYPFSSYRPEAGRVVIRSPWFKFVRARLPAPNQIPWKLLTVTTSRTREGPSLGTAYISLSRAQLPIGFGGLQLTDGFLPTGGTGDRRYGFGMVVAVRRDDLAPLLWTASRGGSRLVAAFDQLTPVGQAAVRSANIAGNSIMNRTLSGPWFVWLPSPSSESELGSWVI